LLLKNIDTAGRCPAPCPLFFGESGAKNFVEENCVFQGKYILEYLRLFSQPYEMWLAAPGQGSVCSLAGDRGQRPQGLLFTQKNTRELLFFPEKGGRGSLAANPRKLLYGLFRLR